MEGGSWDVNDHNYLFIQVSDRSMLGACPNCSEAIADHDVIIEYECTDGSTGVYAECPDCREIIAPE